MTWLEILYRTVFASRALPLEVLSRCCSGCFTAVDVLALTVYISRCKMLSFECGKATGTMLRDSNQYTAVLLKHYC